MNFTIENRRCAKCTMFFPAMKDSDIYCSAKCGGNYTPRPKNRRLPTDYEQLAKESQKRIVEKYGVKRFRED